MYQEGDILVYKRDVCQVKEVKNDQYVLTPVTDSSLKITISKDSSDIRELIKKEKVEEFLTKIPAITTIEVDDKLLEHEYKNLLYHGEYEDLIKIIKTAYLRGEERRKNKKKVRDQDILYLEKAESYLYTEFAYALDKTYDETKEYIINQVSQFEHS